MGGFPSPRPPPDAPTLTPLSPYHSAGKAATSRRGVGISSGQSARGSPSPASGIATSQQWARPLVPQRPPQKNTLKSIWRFVSKRLKVKNPHWDGLTCRESPNAVFVPPWWHLGLLQGRCVQTAQTPTATCIIGLGNTPDLKRAPVCAAPNSRHSFSLSRTHNASHFHPSSRPPGRGGGGMGARCAAGGLRMVTVQFVLASPPAGEPRIRGAKLKTHGAGQPDRGTTAPLARSRWEQCA